MRKVRGSEFPEVTTDEQESWSSNPGWPAGQSALFFFFFLIALGLRSACGLSLAAACGRLP